LVSVPPASATFDVCALRFHFTACETIRFPADSAANLFRGLLGKIMRDLDPDAYSRFFAPSAAPHTGPSGLQNPPRPFVLRTSRLDAATIAASETFHVGVNLFDTAPSSVALFERILSALLQEGLGPGRGRARLDAVEGSEPLHIPLAPDSAASVSRMRVRFLTPTELKGAVTPDFGVLISRIRDRASSLSALYGRGAFDIDFKAIGELASRVTMTRCELERIERTRISRGTGRTHSLGGFVGVAEYSGDIGGFIPYLEIARWTGVGRQTVWGKGEIAFEQF
jgi:hypothetical protein